jgi:hypothetical protein
MILRDNTELDDDTLKLHVYLGRERPRGRLLLDGLRVHDTYNGDNIGYRIESTLINLISPALELESHKIRRSAEAAVLKEAKTFGFGRESVEFIYRSNGISLQ